MNHVTYRWSFNLKTDYVESSDHFSSIPLTCTSPPTKSSMAFKLHKLTQIIISTFPTRPNPGKTHPEPWIFLWIFHKQWINRILSGWIKLLGIIWLHLFSLYNNVTPRTCNGMQSLKPFPPYIYTRPQSLVCPLVMTNRSQWLCWIYSPKFFLRFRHHLNWNDALKELQEMKLKI